MHLDIYKWGDVTLSVVYNSRNARNELIERMEKATVPVGERILKVSSAELRAMYPEQHRLFDGWERNLVKSKAMLALGLSAV
jgi:hypothetical protein